LWSLLELVAFLRADLQQIRDMLQLGWTGGKRPQTQWKQMKQKHQIMDHFASFACWITVNNFVSP